MGVKNTHGQFMRDDFKSPKKDKKGNNGQNKREICHQVQAWNCSKREEKKEDQDERKGSGEA